MEILTFKTGFIASILVTVRPVVAVVSKVKVTH